MRSILNPTDRDNVLARLEQLRPDSKKQWGKMSIEQMLHHCNLGVKQALGELPFEPKVTFMTRTLMKFFVFRMKWPKSSPTHPSLDVLANSSATADFKTEQAALKANLLKFLENPDSADHPFFGNMSKEDWARLTWKHLDHHFRQFGN